jgi:hypothetical protein
MSLGLLGSLALGGLIGGTISSINGGDFLRGAFSGALFGGIGGLVGGAFAPAVGAGQTASVTAGTAVNIFGQEVSKQVLYQAIGGMMGGYMAGTQVANNAKAERQLRMQRDKLRADERAFRAEMETRQREYEKALGEISSSKEKTVMRQLEKARIREDANDAFMQYIDGGFDENLADVIGGFYGEGRLPKGFV